jgi:ABC-type transport system involved in multi-copper enzyme maturation permease subunit
MSVAAVAPPASARLRRSQAWAVFLLELRKLLVGRGSIGLLLFGLAPVGLLGSWVVVAALLSSEGVTVNGAGGEFGSLADATVVFAAIYRGFILAMIVFFACVMVFLNLVRREVRDRSLHYYFLVPARREVVLFGKYAAGVAATSLVLGLSTVICHLLAYVPFLASAGPEVERFFRGGPGLAHLGAYLGVTVLGCLGYGAVFLALSLHFKNPILPALAVYGWEWLHFLLPPALKKLSVVHYLGALTPVPVSEGPFALLAAPPAPWLAVVGLLLFAGVLLALSARRVRRMEILYGED